MSASPPSSDAPESGLAAFLPIDRRHALARGEELEARAEGCVLFTDISGFTGLADALAGRFGLGRGSEELTATLNHIYGGLIDEVHRFGGSVLDFSGDGFVAWFDGASGDRAVASALALQAAMARLSASDRRELPTPIGVKVGLASGTVHRMTVGDPSIQRLDVLAGDPVQRVARAEGRARVGEVVATAELADTLGESIARGDERVDVERGERFVVIRDQQRTVAPRPWPTLARTLEPDEVAPWLHADVFERLRSGQGEFLAELRLATALFLRFPELDFETDPVAGEKLDAYVRFVQRVVARHDGALMSLTIGDKGAYLYANFGGLRAHEDDAARAVAAALELRATPSAVDLGAEVSIGIATGRMCAGAYGGATRRIHGVLGSPANLAARLMQSAGPGEIRVDEAVKDAARNSYEFSPVGALALKGKTQAVPAFLVGAASTGSPDLKLAGRAGRSIVGRRSERSRIAAAVAGVVARENHTLIIEGEAGVGKSRLVLEALERLEQTGVRTLLTTGNAIEQSAPYHPWRSVFHSVFDLGAAPEAAEARRVFVLERLPDDEKLRAMAPLLDAVLPAEWPETEATRRLAGAARGSALQDLLVAVLVRHQGDEPLAIVVEDAHLLDSASWLLAWRTARELAPLLLLLARRVPAEGAPEPPTTPEERDLLGAQTTERIRLGPMPREEVRELVCDRLGARNLSEPLLDLIEERAGGHPLFSEEFAFALRDRGWIARFDGDCELVARGEGARALDFPETVEGVITSRIDRMAPAHQLCLKVASVLGESFSFRALREVFPEEADRAALPASLETLEREGILRVESREPELRYGFKHALVQEAAYKRLLHAQRKGLHRSAAEWTERLHAAEPERFYPLIAHHWRMAGANAKAVEFLDRSSELAVRHGAFQEAISFVRQAVETEREGGVATGDEREVARQRILGDAYYGLGQIVDGQTHLEESLAAMGMPVPAGNLRLAAGLLRQASTQLLHRLAPRLFLGRARDPAKQLRNADTLFQLVPVYFIVTNMGRFLYAALRGLNRAESAFGELEVRKLVAEGYGDLAIVTGGLGWRRVANAYRERAEALGRQIGDARTLAHVHQSNSLYSLGAADCEIAEKALLEGRGLLRGMLGERRRYEEISGMHAWLGTLQARYERAIEIWRDIHAGAVRRGDRQSQAVALAGRSEHVFMLGRSGYLEDCEQCLWQARELLPERNDRLFDIHFHGLMAAIRLRRGSPSDARVDLDRAAAIAGESRVMLGYGMVVYARVPELYLEMAEAELARSGQRELRDAGRRALRTLRRFVASWPAGLPRLSRCEGLLARLDGNPSRAARAFERSLEQAQRFAMPYDEGRALFELGRLDPTGGRTSLEQARELFSRLGTRYEHDLATNALSRLPVP